MIQATDDDRVVLVFSHKGDHDFIPYPRQGPETAIAATCPRRHDSHPATGFLTFRSYVIPVKLDLHPPKVIRADLILLADASNLRRLNLRRWALALERG